MTVITLRCDFAKPIKNSRWNLKLLSENKTNLKFFCRKLLNLIHNFKLSLIPRFFTDINIKISLNKIT